MPPTIQTAETLGKKIISACLLVSEPPKDTASHHFPHPPPKTEELEITPLLQTAREDSGRMT